MVLLSQDQERQYDTYVHSHTQRKTLNLKNFLVGQCSLPLGFELKSNLKTPEKWSIL